MTGCNQIRMYTMYLFRRISRIIRAQLYDWLHPKPDPEAALAEAISSRETWFIKLRRETVRAVACQRQYQQKLTALRTEIQILEEKARTLVQAGDESQALVLLAKKIHLQATTLPLETEHGRVRDYAIQLKTQLTALENEIQSIRQQANALRQRKQMAEKNMQFLDATQTSSFSYEYRLDLNPIREILNRYEQDILTLEAQVEAFQSLGPDDRKFAAAFNRVMASGQAAAALSELKQQLRPHSGA